jgi:hypothetical protein
MSSTDGAVCTFSVADQATIGGVASMPLPTHCTKCKQKHHHQQQQKNTCSVHHIQQQQHSSKRSSD